MIGECLTTQAKLQTQTITNGSPRATTVSVARQSSGQWPEFNSTDNHWQRVSPAFNLINGRI